MSVYTSISDQELVLLLKSGDERAYTEIYDRYSATLLVHAYHKLHDQEEAKDLVHELFMVLWSKKEALVIEKSLSAYLFMAIKNRVIDKMAHEKIKTNYAESLQELLDEGHCITEESIREKELMQLIDQEIASLPEKMRQVFQFSRKDYYSHKEISAILNISEQTVKKQVQNALKIIKLRLASFLF